VLAKRRRILGAEHPETLTSMNSLAASLWAAGDLEGARALYEDVIAGRSKVHGADHPYTVASASDLAELLRSDPAGREGPRASQPTPDGATPDSSFWGPRLNES
jgi:hypothetical protein